ncbi:MAG: HlyD family type I secretion periplasmic adaptor subunit [Rhodocyclaceae bacterium]|nr:HlyD family type I secretion periplasmic adaptor subunit [Rhodocyclaceae bacterium]
MSTASRVPQPLSAHPDFDRGPRRAVIALLALIGVLLAGGLLWMNFAQLDISVNAVGKVIPSSRVQQIQSLEGGIIQAINVREGQQVHEGQVLAYVQNVQFSAELGETRQAYLSARAIMARLDAELSGGALDFPDDVRRDAPGMMAEQRALFESRMQERRSVAETLRGQRTQRSQELAEARARARSLAAQLGPAQETLSIEERLSAQGAGARTDLLAAQTRFTSLQGELAGARIAVRRLQAGVDEAESRLRETDARYQAEASRERAEAEQELSALTQQLTTREDRVTRRELRAPMDGVVNRVLISTVGGVAQPGETIIELVPVEDTLLISARVKPSEIAFIRPGHEAQVRVSAYDASIFGVLKARVLRVGADAIQDERQDVSYFEVFLETERNYLGAPEERLTISPGMAADASINTGKRTLMEYLLKPIVKTFDKALRER